MIRSMENRVALVMGNGAYSTVSATWNVLMLTQEGYAELVA